MALHIINLYLIFDQIESETHCLCDLLHRTQVAFPTNEETSHIVTLGVIDIILERNDIHVTETDPHRSILKKTIADSIAIPALAVSI